MIKVIAHYGVDVAELAAHFDIDIRSADFWRSTLDVVRKDIDKFEMAVHSVQAPYPAKNASELIFLHEAS